uniref:Semaphorin 7A, GPI membrane anchor (John Milton Hagen blood group) n=1 Tax=Nothobranchius rachovii TaxID=451742 RepID=A0A1A8PVD8_9TELE
MVMLSPQSMYYLSCPVLSHHARYTWHHPGGVLPCNHLEDQCIFLIDNMSEAREGKYKCESEESGYSRVLEEHELQLSRTSEAGTLGPTVWVCVSALMVFEINPYLQLGASQESEIINQDPSDHEDEESRLILIGLPSCVYFISLLFVSDKVLDPFSYNETFTRNPLGSFLC